MALNNKHIFNINRRLKVKSLLVLIILTLSFFITSSQKEYNQSYANSILSRTENEPFRQTIKASSHVFPIIEWSETLCVSENDSNYSFQPEIAIDNTGNVFVVWYDEQGSRDEIYFREFSKQKNLWLEIQILSNISAEVNSGRPIITLDNNDNIHVSWWDFIGANETLLYRYQNDKIWSEIIEVTTCTNAFMPHEIVTNDNGLVFFFWDEQATENSSELFFRSYSLLSKEFSEIKQVTSSGIWGSSFPSAVIDSQEQIHLVWEDRTTEMIVDEIYYQFFNGSIWHPEQPIILSQIDSILDIAPKIAIDENDNIHVVWDHWADLSEVLYRAKINNSWQIEEKMSGRGSAGYSEICTDKNNDIHLVWDENNWVIYKQYSNTIGWSENYNLSHEQAIVIFPKVSADLYGRIHIVWNDWWLDHNWEVFHKIGLREDFLKQQKATILLFVISSSIVISSFMVMVLYVIRRSKEEN